LTTPRDVSVMLPSVFVTALTQNDP